jgi:hypothetical protein
MYRIQCNKIVSRIIDAMEVYKNNKNKYSTELNTTKVQCIIYKI